MRKRCDERMEKINEEFAERLSEPVGAVLTILQSRSTLDFEAGEATRSIGHLVWKLQSKNYQWEKM